MLSCCIPVDNPNIEGVGPIRTEYWSIAIQLVKVKWKSDSARILGVHLRILSSINSSASHAYHFLNRLDANAVRVSKLSFMKLAWYAAHQSSLTNNVSYKQKE